ANKAIEDRDRGDAKDYDVMRARSVVFPQVQIGSRLKIRYKIKTAKPVLQGRWSTEITVAPGYFREDFQVTVNSELPLHTLTSDPRDTVTVKRPKKNKVVVIGKAKQAGWVHAEKDPYFHPDSMARVWVSTENDWAEFFRPLTTDLEKVLSAGVPKDLGDWVAQAKKKKTVPEKIGYLQERMSTEFRYFGDWRRHNGGIVPRELQEIEASRYGDCKDLSTLLTALLRALDIDARVALVRRGENPWGREPDYRLPVLIRFNHAIVHVKDGERTYWLDPTNPVSSLMPFPDIAGRPAWLVGADAFARLPENVSRENHYVQNFEYRFTGDDDAKVKVQVDARNMAASEIANSLMLAPRSEILSQILEQFSEDNEVKSFKFPREPSTGRTLKDIDFTLEYDTGRITYNAGKNSFWVMPDGFLEGPFYETEERESDLRLTGEPYLITGARRLKDMRLAQDLPAPCAVESEWMNLSRKVQVEGNDVVIHHNVELKRPFIRREEFRSAAFKELQARTKHCYLRSGVLLESVRKR
ncbi:MAG TPA: transglutaminase domain-containing protein, partial [Bdellovibrionales bacterium]|nr:transglutaminase domain-containing protein [Bdellovibrionales bacterium]